MTIRGWNRPARGSTMDSNLVGIRRTAMVVAEIASLGYNFKKEDSVMTMEVVKMQRVRVTVNHNAADPADDLRCAARLRRDLWAHSPVEIDPDSPTHGTHRDSGRNAYFEFATDLLPEVERILKEYGYAARARVEVVANGDGSECVNCGNISPHLVTVCPNCSFRDIDPCPYCNREVARLSYSPVHADVFKCPACHRRVRFRFHDPLVNTRGRYNQPLVRVSPAEAPVGHDV
jgi:hypothetical protein